MIAYTDGTIKGMSPGLDAPKFATSRPPTKPDPRATVFTPPATGQEPVTLSTRELGPQLVPAGNYWLTHQVNSCTTENAIIREGHIKNGVSSEP